MNTRGIEGREAAEELTGQEMLYNDDIVSIYHPRKQAIPFEQGMQLVVEPKELTMGGEAEALFASMGVAKAMSEGRHTEEFWANIQRNSHPGTEKGINIFGRNPQSEEAWGKPVDIIPTDKRTDQPLEERQKVKLQRTFESYIPRWETASKRVTLFDGGINPVDPNTEEFQQKDREGQEKAWPWQSITAWMSDKWQLDIALQPHIRGVHFVLGPRKEYAEGISREDFRSPERAPIKAWETPKNSEGSLEYLEGVVESYVILRGVQEILEKQSTDRKVYNGEIHFSGNWGFAPLDAGPDARGRRVDESYLQAGNLDEMERERKATKVSHQRGPWMSQGKGWASHGHYYATDSPDRFVNLPSRPKSEKPEEWQEIPEMDVEQAKLFTQEIQTKLNQWLEQNAQGVKLG